MEFLVAFVAVLVVVPALTLVRPEVLPATVLMIVMPLGVFMAFKERRAIDASRVSRTCSRAVFWARSGALDSSCWCRTGTSPYCSGYWSSWLR
jgi:hypothetical protein